MIEHTELAFLFWQAAWYNFMWGTIAGTLAAFIVAAIKK